MADPQHCRSGFRRDPGPAPVRVGNADIAPLSMEEVIEHVESFLTSGAEPSPLLIFTANIQHIAELRSSLDFRRAYAFAGLVVPDGWPVAALVGRRHGRRQQRVTGSDLLPALCEMSSRADHRVGFLGGRQGSAPAAAQRMMEAWPALQVVLVEDAPRGFDLDTEKLQVVLERVRRARPDVLFVGLGTPKQELFLAQNRTELGARVAVGVGAAIDFAAGAVPRAPRVLRRLGLEWLYRIAHEPVRLFPRYVKAFGPFLAAAARGDRAPVEDP